MNAKIIDGKKISAEINEELKGDIEKLKADGITPGLVAVLVGENPASKVYVNMKRKRCDELCMYSDTIKMAEDTKQEDLIEVVEKLNNDPKVHGILVQLPLPKHLKEEEVLRRIDPKKDVDCFHPFNLGRLFIGNPIFQPCTPSGVVELLVRSGYSPKGKNAVIVGRSNIVGKPLAVMLMQKADKANATVTICHSRTQDIAKHCADADILVAAIGKPKFITKDMVKEGAVVIDVGVNRVDDPAAKRGYRLVGDVDYDNVLDKVEAITPVPGGVGPMTIVMLMGNTVRAARLLNEQA